MCHSSEKQEQSTYSSSAPAEAVLPKSKGAKAVQFDHSMIRKTAGDYEERRFAGKDGRLCNDHHK